MLIPLKKKDNWFMPKLNILVHINKCPTKRKVTKHIFTVMLITRYAGHLRALNELRRDGGVKKREGESFPKQLHETSEVGGSYYRCRPEDLHSLILRGMPQTQRTHSHLSLFPVEPRRLRFLKILFKYVVVGRLT